MNLNKGQEQIWPLKLVAFLMFLLQIWVLTILRLRLEPYIQPDFCHYIIVVYGYIP
jgi:hypothetical protein